MELWRTFVYEDEILDLDKVKQQQLEIDNINKEISLEENKIKLIETELNNCLVMADKDLMLRVFNNLIKNAIQAIPEERKGESAKNAKRTN